jgi:hypothetical protein
MNYYNEYGFMKITYIYHKSYWHKTSQHQKCSITQLIVYMRYRMLSKVPKGRMGEQKFNIAGFFMLVEWYFKTPF